ncbi:hypothetical protein OAJ56_02130 [Flavobacteriales bacterium]|nr:hypothetical protein [Flavobacteriales bacterium]
MKKLLLLLLCVPLIFSCGDDNEDKKVASDKDINILEININEINDACELIDAAVIVFEETIELSDKYFDIEKQYVPQNVTEKLKMLNWKGIEIMERLSVDFDKKDVENCRNFENFWELTKSLRISIQGEKGVLFKELENLKVD